MSSYNELKKEVVKREEKFVRAIVPHEAHRPNQCIELSVNAARFSCADHTVEIEFSDQTYRLSPTHLLHPINWTNSTLIPLSL